MNPLTLLRPVSLGRGLAAAALALAGAAHAGDVYWSIGVHQPGVTVGVGNTPPVVIAPAPRVVMVPPVVVSPPVAVVAPAYGYAMPPGHRKHRHWHPREWERYPGWDDRRGWRDDGWHRHDDWRDRR